MGGTVFGKLYLFSLFLSLEIPGNLSLLRGRWRGQFLLWPFRSYLFSYANSLQKILLRDLGHPQLCHRLSHLKDKSARCLNVSSPLYWAVIHRPCRPPFDGTQLSGDQYVQSCATTPLSHCRSFVISPKETPYPLIVCHSPSSLPHPPLVTTNLLCLRICLFWICHIDRMTVHWILWPASCA